MCVVFYRSTRGEGISATFLKPENVFIPKSINWTAEGAVTEVKDQGNVKSSIKSIKRTFLRNPGGGGLAQHQVLTTFVRPFVLSFEIAYPMASRLRRSQTFVNPSTSPRAENAQILN